MPIVDITPQNTENQGNPRNNPLIRSIMETFRNVLSTKEVTYVDDGFFTIPGSASSQGMSKDGFSDSAQQVAGMLGFQERSFISQEPQATIYIKKKVFAGLQHNFDLKFLGEDEKSFLRATKRLFYNKANEIGAYERLLKVRQFMNDGVALGSDMAWMAAFLMTKNVMDQGEGAQAFSRILNANIEDQESTYTKWIIGINEKNRLNVGLGTGVIEITAFTSFTTGLSLDSPGDLGSCSVTFEDPYHIMFIKVADIDDAIAQTQPPIVRPGVKESFDEVNVIEQEFESEFGKPIEIRFNLKTGTVSEPIWAPSENISTYYNERTKALGLKMALNEYVAIAKKYAEEIVDNNEKNNYLRNKMMKFYNGKAIMQPMDSIHIFVNSNTVRHNASQVAEEKEINEPLLEKDKRAVLSGIGPKTAENFSNFVYRSLRRPDAFYGAQVFAGIINSVKDNYTAQSGKYILTVDASNNMKWLNISRINKAPALEQQHGLLEDPLTPFVIKPDAMGFVASGAVDYLPENKNLLSQYFISVKGGLLDGTILNESQLIPKNSGFDDLPETTHLPGLRYRWKEGLFTATQNFNIESPGVIFNAREDLSRRYGITMTNTPFDNLDSANIISLLVTGYPYNFEKFLRNAIDAGNFSLDSMFNGGEDYFNNLFDVVRTQNKVFGGFIPYTLIGASPAHALRHNLKIEEDINKNNSARRRITLEIAKIDDELRELDLTNKPATSTDETSENWYKRALILDANLKAKREQLQKGLEEVNWVVAELEGNKDNTSYYSTPCEYRVNTSTSTVDNIDEESQIKNRLESQIFKRKADVKYNRDKNLFIVSDEYDKDTDIQAFVLNLKSQSPEMFEAQQAYCYPLDICNEAAGMVDFEFFADANGNIQFRPPQYNKTPISVLQQMFKLGRLGKKSYDPFLETMFATRISIAEQKIEDIEQLVSFYNAIKDGESAEYIKNTIVTRDFPRGKFPIGDELTDQYLLEQRNSNYKMAVLNNDIEDLQNEKSMLEQYVQKIKEAQTKQNSGFLKEIDGLTDDIVINPLNYHLVEFDNVSEIGFGSGKRFIINDDVILGYDFTESDQNVTTRVDVLGQQNMTNTSYGTFAMPQDIWAGGVDFDLWQQYGYRYADASKAFFNDADSQCRPYAAFLLTRQRKNIITGSVNIIGNEYYQLGDVVYITDRELLYYVTGISHSFDFSGTFSTTLQLKYGHVPGDYIPTPLDIIGKTTLSGKKKEFGFVRKNSISDRTEREIATIVVMSDDRISDDDATVPALKNAYIIAGNRINSANEVKLILRAFYKTDKSIAEKSVAMVKAWFDRPLDKNGYEIDFSGCKLNVSVDMETEVLKLITSDDADIDVEQDKVFSPSEGTMAFISEQNIDPEYIVEVMLNFETKDAREKRRQEFINFE